MRNRARPEQLHQLRLSVTKAGLVLGVFLAAPSAAFAADEQQDNPFSDEAWLREGVARQAAKYKHIEFSPHPADKHLVAANCETDPSWWGDFMVFHRTGDKVDWIAKQPKAYTERRGCFILSCQWRHLEKVDRWFLEVFDNTHMGNGSFWLYSLEGHKLNLLFRATAMGQCFDAKPEDLEIHASGEARFSDPHLTATYRVPKGGKFEAVFLTGDIQVTNGVGEEVMVRPYTARWDWIEKAQTFVRKRK